MAFYVSYMALCFKQGWEEEGWNGESLKMAWQPPLTLGPLGTPKQATVPYKTQCLESQFRMAIFSAFYYIF